MEGLNFFYECRILKILKFQTLRTIFGLGPSIFDNFVSSIPPSMPDARYNK